MKCETCEWNMVVNAKTGDGLCTLPSSKVRRCSHCEWFAQDAETGKGFCASFKRNTDELDFGALECKLFECCGDVSSIYDE